MAKVSVDLSGKWEFKEYPAAARRMRDLESGGWMQATMPGSVYKNLIEAGQLSETDLYENPEKYRQISEKPWVYRKKFDICDELFDCERLEVVFDGLDTITSIWLNNRLIGRTDNMFTAFWFNVKSLLKPKNNSLLIKFEPAVAYSKKLMARYTKFDESDFINPHRVYIRKAQFQFGWDFCPQLPGCGIRQTVRLEGTKKAKIANVHVRTIDCNHKYADVKIDITVDAAVKGRFTCELDINCEKQNFKQTLTFNPGQCRQSTVIHIKGPLLWWPRGYGTQNLYQLGIKLLSDDQLIDQKQTKFGIRIVKLNRSKTGKSTNFCFEVNGRKIFARGANWVPASIFTGSVTKTDYEVLLNMAAQANINMLRVWGGGYYETEDFYRLCDRLGIMVWQDFMFACGCYPDRKWFVEQVKNEAGHIIKRLRNHPCLVLWCGNNEIDQMHSTGKLGKSKKFYGKDIYHKLLGRLVAELDPDTDYIPTTPLSEKEKFRPDRLLTVHQWDIWSGHQPIDNYLCPPEQIPQFVTEFGLQSMPTGKSLRRLCPAKKPRIGTQNLEKHNYQQQGNSRLYRYTADYFGPVKDPLLFAYASQLVQARAAKLYVEHLRANNTKNNGVLFWQFNDCFPAITWSAIDYDKQPKALYFYAKRFFANRLLTAEFQPNEHQRYLPPQAISVIVLNDCPEPLTATLNCSLTDLAGEVLDKVTVPVAVGPFGKTVPLKLPRAIANPAARQKCCLHLKMENDSGKIAQNSYFYLPDKYIEWPEVEFEKNLSQIASDKWLLKIKSNAVAKDVRICLPDGFYVSDNFFDMLPADETEIIIKSCNKTDKLESQLLLRSVKSIF